MLNLLGAIGSPLRGTKPTTNANTHDDHRTPRADHPNHHSRPSIELDAMLKMATKGMQIAQELLTTEGTYHQTLHAIIKLYVEPLQKSLEPHSKMVRRVGGVE